MDQLKYFNDHENVAKSVVSSAQNMYNSYMYYRGLLLGEPVIDNPKLLESITMDEDRLKEADKEWEELHLKIEKLERERNLLKTKLDIAKSLSNEGWSNKILGKIECLNSLFINIINSSKDVYSH